MLTIHDRLSRQYTLPVIHQSDRLGPISRLIDGLIADGVSPERADAAFRALCFACSTWAEVRDAPASEIRRALIEIDPRGLKAAIIVNALTAIGEAGSWLRPSLDFLLDWSTDDALSWLCRIEGVSPAIAAQTLLLSTICRAILPVDTAHQRVVERLGILRAHTAPRDAQRAVNELLPDNWRRPDFEAHYFLVNAVSRRFCVPRDPKCPPCPIRNSCRTGQARTR
jgi:endonuclease-3